MIEFWIRHDEPQKIVIGSDDFLLIDHRRQTKSFEQPKSGIPERYEVWLVLHESRCDDVKEIVGAVIIGVLVGPRDLHRGLGWLRLADWPSLAVPRWLPFAGLANKK